MTRIYRYIYLLLRNIYLCTLNCILMYNWMHRTILGSFIYFIQVMVYLFCLIDISIKKFYLSTLKNILKYNQMHRKKLESSFWPLHFRWTDGRRNFSPNQLQVRALKWTETHVHNNNIYETFSDGCFLNVAKKSHPENKDVKGFLFVKGGGGMVKKILRQGIDSPPPLDVQARESLFVPSTVKKYY